LFLPAIKAWFFWPPFFLVCYGFIFINFYRNNRLDFIRPVASYWMGFSVYLFILLIVLDIVRLAFKLGERVNFPMLYAGAVCLSLIITVCGAINARTIKTIQYNINLSGEGNDLRVALISDIHIGPTVGKAWLGRIAGAVNAASPDIVCIAGDVFDGDIDKVKDLQGVISALRGIHARLGVYACLGNHDVDRMMGQGDSSRIVQAIRQAGITVLLDESADAGPLIIAGRRDARPIGRDGDSEENGRGQRMPAAELISSGEKPVIVLDHQPVDFAQIEQAGADLVFSGHTHRGQIFPAGIVTRVMFKKAGGTHYGYWKGDTLQAVVTSGAGVWGPPMRVGTNSEVVIINISFTQ
jgi:predicted MPP superfamily phosphohydrolase